MIEVGIVLVFAAIIGLIIVLVGTAKAEKAKTMEAWTTAAEALDGEVVLDETGGEETPVLRAEVGGVKVRVDIEVRPVGDARQPITRVRAASTAPQHMSIKLRRGDVHKLGRLAMMEDLEIGDEAFDEAFLVKCSDAEFARAWLNKTVRKRVLESDYPTFEVHRGRASAERELVDMDPARLERAVRAVAALADGRQYVVRQFKKLAKRLGGKADKPATGWARVEAQLDSTGIVVETMEQGSTHYNVSKAKVNGEELTPLVLTNDRHEFSPTLPAVEMDGLPEGYSAWTSSKTAAAGLLNEEVKRRIDELQPIKVRIDPRQVSVYLTGVCPPLSRMQRAARLAAEIAAAAG
jgi:hypothetical protein